MKAILNKLFRYQNLTAIEASELFKGIAEGAYNDSQVASLMTVYLMRNISVDELLGFRDALLEYSKPVDFGDSEYIDIVGTGGDGKDTFNISSCASVVVAAAGYRVVKHGNYGSTSISGASNLFEYNGVKFTDNMDILKRSLDECNFAYLHAPMFNSAMKAVAKVRRELGVRTFFNMLGPIINPSKPKYQLLGVFNLAMLRAYQYILQRSSENFAVVHSIDGCDEISLTSEFKVSSLSGEHIYTPENIGFKTGVIDTLFSGTTIAQASQIFISVLDGSAQQLQRDVVVVNAAFAISVIDPSKSILESIEIAKESIDSGRALQLFKKIISINS